jgi:hypothetical protein
MRLGGDANPDTFDAAGQQCKCRIAGLVKLGNAGCKQFGKP